MDQIADGLHASWKMAWGAMPMLLLGFVLAGQASVWIPKGIVETYMGKSSGFSGVLIGWGLGMAVPLVTSTLFPVIALMLAMQVSTAALVTFLTAWGLIQIQRLVVWEISFLGWELALIRFAVCFFIPPLAGWLCELLRRNL